MRYLLYTYKDAENFWTTRRERVFGARKDGGDHLATKIERVSPGDIIVIRDGSKDRLNFLGYCAVGGYMHDQQEGSPWPDLLWPDEQRSRRVIYHLRCAVDFEAVPQLNLARLQWSDLDSLGFLNDRGKPITGQQAWGKKLTGNFIEDEREIAAFHELVRYEPA